MCATFIVLIFNQLWNCFDSFEKHLESMMANFEMRSHLSVIFRHYWHVICQASMLYKPREFYHYLILLEMQRNRQLALILGYERKWSNLNQG